ncbi:MAG: DNA polymerase III subunit delta [Lachnospiraceae bacterium]|nr:DNA polymerase III subunit delta [Lachnospiraceae bacterium]
MKKLMSDLKEGTFQHLYLLTGEEAYLKRQYRDRLVHALIPEENSLNLTVFTGKQVSEAEIIEQAETLPFFSDRRVIVLEQTGFFKNAAERLPEYFASLPDYLYIVCSEDEVDKRNRMYKAVSKNGYVAEFPRQTDATLSTWTARLLISEGLQIRPSTMEYLLEKTGTDMTHIRLETDKLIHYCLSKRAASDDTAGSEGDAAQNAASAQPVPEVTREDIDAIITDQTENRIFDMIFALTEHKRRAAMDLYADLLALREPSMRILYLIGLQYNRLLLIHELDAEGAGASEIASKAGMPPFAVKKNLRLARSYSREKLEECVRQCVAADEGVKTGRMSDQLAVEMLLMAL